MYFFEGPISILLNVTIFGIELDKLMIRGKYCGVLLKTEFEE